MSALLGALEALRAAGLVVTAATGLAPGRAGVTAEAQRQRASPARPWLAPAGLASLALPGKSCGADVAAASLLAATDVPVDVGANCVRVAGQAGVRAVEAASSSLALPGAAAGPLPSVRALQRVARAATTHERHILAGMRTAASLEALAATDGSRPSRWWRMPPRSAGARPSGCHSDAPRRASAVVRGASGAEPGSGSSGGGDPSCRPLTGKQALTVRGSQAVRAAVLRWCRELQAATGGHWGDFRGLKQALVGRHYRRPVEQPAPGAWEGIVAAAAMGRAIAAASLKAPAPAPPASSTSLPAWRCLPPRWAPQVVHWDGSVLGAAGPARAAAESLRRGPAPRGRSLRATSLPTAAALAAAQRGLGVRPSFKAALRAAATACAGEQHGRGDGGCPLRLCRRSGPRVDAQGLGGRAVAAAAAAALVAACADGPDGLAGVARLPTPGSVTVVSSGVASTPGRRRRRKRRRSPAHRSLGSSAGSSSDSDSDSSSSSSSSRESARQVQSSAGCAAGSAAGDDSSDETAAAAALLRPEGAGPATAPRVTSMRVADVPDGAVFAVESLSEGEVATVFAAVAELTAALAGSSLRLLPVGAASSSERLLQGEWLGWATSLCFGC